MSDHSVARRRLASLEMAIEGLEREWADTEGAGPVSHYTDMMAVSARDHMTTPDLDHETDIMLNVSTVVSAMRELRTTLREIAEHTERFAAQHGAVDWHGDAATRTPPDSETEPDVSIPLPERVEADRG